MGDGSVPEGAVGERTGGAVAAALAVATAAGLKGLRPVVVGDAWHVLVRLEPLPLLARVSVDRPFPEGFDPEQLVRELALARHAAAAGAPVVPPADELEPGPHRHDGHVVTFWRYVEEPGPADPRAAGLGLRAIHEALAGYDGALPETAHPAETEQLLAVLPPSGDVELLRRAAAARPASGGQALHGDAHLGNCLSDRGTSLWHDFETACRGPREYDLAALVLRDRVGGDPRAREALAAYGEHDAELVEAWLPPYAAWVWASLLTALARRPELAPVLRERLAWLRGRVG